MSPCVQLHQLLTFLQAKPCLRKGVWCLQSDFLQVASPGCRARLVTSPPDWAVSVLGGLVGRNHRRLQGTDFPDALSQATLTTTSAALVLAAEVSGLTPANPPRLLVLLVPCA